VFWDHQRDLSPVLNPIVHHRPSSQLTFRTWCQTSRGHTCQPSLAMSHRFVTRLPSIPDLSWKRCPGGFMAWSIPRGQWYTCNWPLEVSNWNLNGSRTWFTSFCLHTECRDLTGSGVIFL